MIVNPKKIIEIGAVTGIGSDKQIQQNGIDLRIDKLYRVRGSAYLGENFKTMPAFDEVNPRYKADQDAWVFDLASGQSYGFDTVEGIKVPENMMALIVTRSTLNRVGARITSGVWDSGFESANIGGLITSQSIPIFLEKNSRVCQIIFYEADAASLYSGQYQKGNSASVGK